MSYPNGYGCYDYYHKVFGLWNDSVAVSTRGRGMQFIDIWVPDKTGGVEESWIKCLCIEPVVNFGSPLAFVGKSGQSILVAMDGCVVILYDFTTAKWKYLPVDGVSLWRSQAIFYVNSLVSVKGYTDCGKR